MQVAVLESYSQGVPKAGNKELVVEPVATGRPFSYPITVTDYAPRHFEGLRTMFGVERADFIKAFQGDFRELGFSGKSGAALFITEHETLVVKTITPSELYALSSHSPANFFSHYWTTTAHT